MKTTFLQTAAIAFAMCFLLTDCGQKQQKASGNGDSVTAMDSDSAAVTDTPAQEEAPSLAEQAVGKWQSTSSEDGNSINLTVTLAPNGRCAVTSGGVEVTPSDSGEESVSIDGMATAKGRWQMDGKMIVMYLDVNSLAVTINNVSITAADGNLYSLEEYTQMSGEDPNFLMRTLRQNIREGFINSLEKGGKFTIPVENINSNEIVSTNGRTLHRI